MSEPSLAPVPDPTTSKATGPLIAVPFPSGPAETRPAASNPTDPDGDSLAAFASETQPGPGPRAAIRWRVPLRTISVALTVMILAAIVSWVGWQSVKPPVAVSAAPAVETGAAVFNSVPEGAAIVIDGVARGTTPLRLSLPVGPHKVEITSGSFSRTLPLMVQAGSVASQHVEFAGGPQSLGGRLEIGSQPPGAEVRVDGVPRGRAPLVLQDISIGQHRVAVIDGNHVVNSTVNVTAGATATMIVSMAGPAADVAGGWLVISAPLEMEIFEGGRLLGTTRSDRVMLPAGSHEIELRNADLEFTTTRTVQIAAGKTATAGIPLPNGTLSINALPWAEVSVDGRPVGTTPLGNLEVPIGRHEIGWRHPELGERRQMVNVKAQSPTRIGMDLRK
jgi:eukaryotic-like serine/threonine-protein kinase